MNKSRRVLEVFAVLATLFTGSLAIAEVKTITATGEYRMGDNDTRSDAKRLALLEAKRLVLEQAGICSGKRKLQLFYSVGVLPITF